MWEKFTTKPLVDSGAWRRSNPNPNPNCNPHPNPNQELLDEREAEVYELEEQVRAQP